jgi:hypothetical protein
VSITIVIDNQCNEIDAAETDAWAQFAADNIDAALAKIGADAMPIEVELGDPSNEGEIRGASDEQAEDIELALSDLWQRWCEEGEVQS